MLAQVEAREALQEFKRQSSLYRATVPLQRLWDAIFPDSIDWELGWSAHLQNTGQMPSGDAALAAGSSVPRVFAALPARKVDYLLGLAREAAEAEVWWRARELVAEARLEAAGVSADDECWQEITRLANEIEVAALDEEFPY